MQNYTSLSQDRASLCCIASGNSKKSFTTQKAQEQKMIFNPTIDMIFSQRLSQTGETEK